MGSGLKGPVPGLFVEREGRGVVFFFLFGLGLCGLGGGGIVLMKEREREKRKNVSGIRLRKKEKKRVFFRFVFSLFSPLDAVRARSPTRLTRRLGTF